MTELNCELFISFSHDVNIDLVSAKVCESLRLAGNLKVKLESICSEVFSNSGVTIRCHCLPCFI